MTTPRIIRVFPRKTKATPTDALAYFGPPPPDRLAEADEIRQRHVHLRQAARRISRRAVEAHRAGQDRRRGVW